MKNATAVTLTIGDVTITAPAQTVIRGMLENLITPANDDCKASNEKYARIGEIMPEQGGVLAGIMRGENGLPDYYLIVPTDAKASTETTYGGYSSETPDANSDFDGLANTHALCNADKTHPAAEWAANLTIDGHSDFYLPARRELSLCYANAPELFEKRWHWSSTQGSADYAFVQGFNGGDQGSNRKDGEYRVRAVRRLLIIQ